MVDVVSTAGDLGAAMLNSCTPFNYSPSSSCSPVKRLVAWVVVSEVWVGLAVLEDLVWVGD